MRALILSALAVAGVAALPERLESSETLERQPPPRRITVPLFEETANGLADPDYTADHKPFVHQPLIDHINSVQNYWRAADPNKGEYHKFADWTVCCFSTSASAHAASEWHLSDV